jgi:hypothetical protein
MRTWLRGKITLLFMTFGLLLAIPAIALASDANVTSVVDVNTPTGAVTLQPGQSENITINMTVTGNQAGTATFEVNQDWELQYDAVTDTYNFVGSNSKEFTVPPQSGGTTTPFSTTGKVSVASGVPAGGPRTLTVGVFDITNTNTTGAKLAAGTSATYDVTVATPPPPSDTTPPTVTAIARADANPTNTTGNLVWNVTFSENVTGVNASDFALANTGLGGTPAITNVSGSGANYSVTASTGSGNGTLGLNLVDDDTIVDGASNKLGGTGTGNGNLTGEEYTIDRTAPTVTATAVKGDAPSFTGANTYAANTWTNKDVRVTFTCADTGGSNLTTTSGNQEKDFTAETSGATATFDGTCADNAGNTAAASDFGPIKIDKSAPTNVAFVGGPDAGGSYDPDSVPDAPTCTANGDISGLASCLVTGYSANAGNHTMTATATDNATNVATANRSYSVLGWDLRGFYQPVDMTITNTAKAGQTVPLKFEMFEKVSGDERTNVSDVKTFAQKVTCGTFTPTEDAIEEYSSGGTSLRYDTTGGQFIFNWQTPKAAGSCFKVTMTPNDTSSNALVANFKLR